MNRSRGVTLIELLVTIAILGILVGIAAPSMKQFIDRSRLAASAQAVYDQLQYARSEAIARNRNITVVIDDNSGGANWCIGVTTLNACDCQNPSSCTLSTLGGASDIARKLQGGDYNPVTLSTNATPWVIVVPRNTVSAPTPSPTINLVHPAVTGDTEVSMNVLGRVKVCSDILSQFGGCS